MLILRFPRIRNGLEGTLRALNRDYVDAYLVHWRGSYFNTAEKSETLCMLMRSLRESGKAKTVGLSNFRDPDLKRLGNGLSEFVINQIPYNLLQREYEDGTRDQCAASGIGYMAFSPTARGLLAGRIDAAARKSPTRQQYYLYSEPYFSRSQRVWNVLQSIAQELGAPPVNVALAWVLAQENVTTAVVGSRKVEQIREFCEAGDLQLSSGHLNRLNEASEQFRADTSS